MNKLNSNHERKEEEKLYEELYEKLKIMKFSGMAEELRKQGQNAESTTMNFEERFIELVNAEWNLRYNKKFQRYLKKSEIKIPGASFDEKLYDPERGLNITLIERLNSCEWIETGQNLLITGMTGTGKSFYANALGIAALKQFKTVRYKKASKLLTELDSYRQMDDKVKILNLIEQLSKVDLLIIDDFGLMELDIEKCRDLFEILDGREGRKSTIVISQLPVKEWYDLFKDSTYADACLDRLLYKSYRLEFKGDSLRKKDK